MRAREGGEAWPVGTDSRRSSRFRPMATKRRKIFSEFSNDFIESYPIQIQNQISLSHGSICKIKYKSTSSHNKICSGMNETNIFTNLNK
jgi:hypothetical protein